MGAWIALTLLLIAGLTLVLRNDATTLVGVDTVDIAAVIAAVGLLIFLAGPALGRPSGRASALIRDLGIWGGIALVVFTVVYVRSDLAEFLARPSAKPENVSVSTLRSPIQVTDAEGAARGKRALRVRRKDGRGFVTNTRVNGVNLTMLIDTGATFIVLRNEDAARVGVNVRKLDYDVPLTTAGGETLAASVRLGTLFAGPVGLRNVEALVVRPGALKSSLLGMSFLSRLRNYRIQGEFFTLQG